jgi:nucleotidyltransferase/DNA polymerase involved in DNA repair
MENKRFIVHIDMDAFYAAVEQRDNPDLRGKPVIIGADPKEGKGRGVVCTSSYEARKFGVHSAMPISIAYKKCPKGIFLPVDMEKYEKISHQIREILDEFSPDIEPVSIDEAFLDISSSYKIFGTPRATCLLIKARIKKETGLTASVGLAPIKMAAKIASDLCKPDGFLEVKEEKLKDFLFPLDIDKLWGVGEKTKIAFNRMGIYRIGDLAKKNPEELAKTFGKNGFHVWQLANGIDERTVETLEEPKSVSNEFTFDVDTSDENQIKSVLMFLSEKVARRLREGNLKCKTITLKIRLAGFETFTRAVTIDAPTNFEEVIYKEVKKLYDDFDTKGKAIRLIGVKASGFGETDIQQSLFHDDKSDKKKEKLHEALDKIKNKFGDDAVHRAAVLKGKNTR